MRILFHHYVFNSLFFLDVKFQVLSRENNNVAIPIAFPHLHDQPVVHPPSRRVSHPKDKKFSDLKPLIYPLRRSLTLVRERILITEFIRSPPTLAVYGVTHSLPPGGVIDIFPPLKMRRESIFHTSLALLQRIAYIIK